MLQKTYNYHKEHRGDTAITNKLHPHAVFSRLFGWHKAQMGGYKKQRKMDELTLKQILMTIIPLGFQPVDAMSRVLYMWLHCINDLWIRRYAP